MFNEKIKNVLFYGFLFTCVRALGYTDSTTQDLPSTRANTLSDDADDIQKQLDNEARDKIKYGRKSFIYTLTDGSEAGRAILQGNPKAMWVFHFPMQATGATESINRQPRYPRTSIKHKSCNKSMNPCECVDPTICSDCSSETPKDWNYKDQVNWSSSYPECGGRSQSPVDLPFSGMISTKGTRKMYFINHGVQPKSMIMVHNGKTVFVSGEWAASGRPLIYGGAAYGRRYVFHSLALRWPSDHTVGGLYFPLETQAIFVSVEYSTLEEAVQAASKDKLALLAVANIYKYSERNHKGLAKTIKTVLSTSYGNRTLKALPLKVFSPPLKEYAAYHGSLTTPPCTEAVLWLVRAKPMPITRELADSLDGYSSYGEPGQSYHRLIQPLNDRKIYFFN